MSVKPQIDYPCEWDYTLIGLSEDRLRRAAAEVVGKGLPQTCEPSRRSAGGKYCSLTLRVRVENESQRVGLHEALCRHRDVVMVL